MKKFITLIIALIFFTGCLPADYPTEIAVYDFNTAVIQYELTGQEEGDMTVYLRGDQQATYKTTQAGNILEINLGDKIYSVDMDKATAVELPTTFYESLKAMSAEDQELAIVKKALGIKDAATDPEAITKKVVAGQQCDVYNIPNIGVACIWNGIVIEKEITMLGLTNKTVAVSIQTNVDIPPERFEVPANVIVQ
ncbi:hypothetical protein ACFLZH_00775 [Patescibacteria group bacterium]